LGHPYVALVSTTVFASNPVATAAAGAGVGAAGAGVGAAGAGVGAAGAGGAGVGAAGAGVGTTGNPPLLFKVLPCGTGAETSG
tara:strand:- start:656 stop:904 length:249 start_codon:yes stop_codon:yes gene_type:complete